MHYIAWSGKNINDLVKTELREEYHDKRKAKFPSTCDHHDRTPGLFKQESQGTRMISLTSKCYYAYTCRAHTNEALASSQDERSKAKFSCKGISKKQNPMSWERYLDSLNRSIDKAQNT